MDKLKIKLTESISLCNATTGKPIKEIEKELRSALWPESSEVNKKQNLYTLKIRAMRIWPEQIVMIKRICGVPYEFMFEG